MTEQPASTPVASVSVPLDLLRDVVALSSCEAHGAWCWEHESKPWPCPNERLRRLAERASRLKRKTPSAPSVTGEVL